LATTSYSAGIRNTEISSREKSPPTITIANGRCESEPTPVESAAGSYPNAATSAVIMIGRSLSSAASLIDSATGRPSMRSSFTYEM
jgi:hypothetical protein